MSKHFGNTLRETSMALRGEHFGDEDISLTIKKKEAQARILISFLLIFVAIFFILKADLMPGESMKDVGDLILGAIVGYWLR